HGRRHCSRGRCLRGLVRRPARSLTNLPLANLPSATTPSSTHPDGRGVCVQPFLRGAKALQARYLGIEVDVLPFVVEPLRVQPLHPAEGIFARTRQAPIAV